MTLDEALAAIASLEAKVSGLEEEKAKLIAKRDELISERRSDKERYSKYQDIDVESLIKFKEDKEREELESQGKYADALEKERKRLEKEREDFRRQLQEREDLLKQEKEELARKAEERERELQTLQLDNRVLDEYARAGVIAPKQLLALTKQQLKLNDDRLPVVVDGYREIPVKEWIDSLKRNDEYAHHFRSSGSRGSGAPPAGASGPSGGSSSNPFAKGSWNLTEQAKLYKSNRAEYDRLKAEAASMGG
jgi:DNA repair exonuclease SbcCD ATPase subunit